MREPHFAVNHVDEVGGAGGGRVTLGLLHSDHRFLSLVKAKELMVNTFEYLEDR